VTARRVAIVGAPLLGYLVALLHPRDVAFGDETRLFVGVHLAWTVVLCLLAWMIWLLLEEIEGPAATAARLLTVPFVAAYTLYTAFGGVAVGAFVSEANELPAGRQLGAAELIHDVSHGPLADALYVTASVLWLAVMLSLVVALRRDAPLPALVLVAAGAAAFAWSHVSPWGPAGMAAILAGVVWLELRRERPRGEGDARARPGGA
jgi:hypothetical protein